ncbi:helix-turn-helix transcriptional regulator [Actinopolymorpha alba]|uniref:helix-turn-helix transcriptional regulator n=1 Tax=Actinopolymorpha alba TaxID=533267 RepID=UPI0003753248|nr:helix-turn-helix transcriptional regulator [Actinopolymorpha alba]
MDSRTEVREFLRSRRGKITPEEASLAVSGRRRVPGLRREEVAFLAGVSVDYYARLERGDLSGVSNEVLAAIARALRMDEAETSHLFNLARAAQTRTTRRRRPSTNAAPQIRPTLRRFLDAVTGAPTRIRNERMDFIAANQLGCALYAPVLKDPVRPANNARFMFLNPEAQSFYPDWERGADDIVATLRSYAGRNPNDKSLTDLIGELVTRSDAFRTRWAKHNVRFHRTGIKRIHHPVVGELELNYEAMELPANPGWTMFAYTAEPNSATDERLKLLASYAATINQQEGITQGLDHDLAVREP